MMGVILQVSISPGGVPNHPIARGEVTCAGIVGDGWRHPNFHGIPKRAILLITSEGLDEIKTMGFPVYPGALGENFTTQGVDRRVLRIGRLLRCGSATIQLTEPRFPCEAISVYGKGIQEAIYDQRVMRHDPTSDRWGLSGFYAAVIEPGKVAAGDPVFLK
jgi:MOSC domain-containing protein YiiM